MEPTTTSWESLFHMPGQAEGASLEPTPLRNSLLPAPLRLHSSPATPQSQVPSPPGSPSPTVLVSLRTIESSQPLSGQLSLHEYRKNLSRPLPDPGVVAPTPGRTLKRKPKAANLNRMRTQRTPPSPPPTPPQDNTFPVFAFLQNQPVTPPNHLHRSNTWDNSDASASVSSIREDIHSPFTPITAPCELENTPIEYIFGETRQKSDSMRLTSLRDRLRKIPAKFAFHNKSASESALPTTSTTHRKTFRHRGVSFEILNPKNTPTPNEPQYNLGNSMDTFKDDLTQTPPTRRAVRAVTSPTSGSRRRSLSVGAETRRTPSRALYEDLPTAYSSITSRVATHHKGRFLTSLPDLVPNKLWTQPSPPTDVSQIEPETVYSGTLHRKRQLGTIDPFAPPIISPNPPNELSDNVAITTPHSVQSNLHNTRGRIGKSRTPKMRTRDKFQGPAVNRMVMRNQRPFFIEDGCLASSRALTNLKFRSLTEERRIFWELCVQNNFMMMGEALFPTESKTRAKGIPLFKRRGLATLRPLIVPQFDDRVDALHGTVVSHPHFSRPIVSTRYASEYGSSQDPIIKQQSAPHIPLNASNGSDYIPLDLQNNATKISRSRTEYVAPHALPIHPQRTSSRKDSILSDEMEADDFGPGSSQASSSVHLSQYAGSSLALRSHRQRPSIVPLGSWGSNGANAFFQAKLRTNRSIEQMEPTPIGKYTTHINRPSLYISNTGDHDCDDWETVAGSQQFTDASGNRLAHMESGSSLADYSSFGSLANRTLGSRSSLYHSKQRFSMGGSHSARNNRLSQGRRAYAHSPSRIPARNSAVQHPASGSGMKRASRYGSLGDIVPALKASTSKHPAPRLGSSPPYQHPTPLDNSYPNPFQSAPPPISEKKRRVLQKSEKSDGSNTGLISSIRNSKLHFSNNNHNTSTLHIEDGGSRQQKMASSLKTREESSGWGTISSFNTSRPHSPSYPVVVPAHHIKDKNSRFSNCQLQHGNNNTLNTPKIAPATDPRNSHDSLYLTTSNVHTRPHSRLSVNESHRVYHRRDNSSILAPSCANSSESLIPRTSSVKYPPGSLYLSIRSARDRVLKPRTRQTSVDNSVSSKRETLLSPNNSIRPISKVCQQEGKNDRESRISRSFLATPSASNTPMRTYSSRSTFKNDRDRPKKPDDILRERLSRIETTPISGHYYQSSLSEIGYTARSCTSPLPERPRSAWNPNSTLSRQYTVRRGTASPFASIDEEAAPAAMLAPTPIPMPIWYESTNSCHTFSEPPRLISNPNSRHTKLIASREMGNIITQRRLGQQLILIFSLATPLGWFLVFFIGFGGDSANFLMRWRSWGYVEEFHEKERAVARRMGVVYAVFTFVFALVLLVVLLLV